MCLKSSIIHIVGKVYLQVYYDIKELYIGVSFHIHTQNFRSLFYFSFMLEESYLPRLAVYIGSTRLVDTIYFFKFN